MTIRSGYTLLPGQHVVIPEQFAVGTSNVIIQAGAVYRHYSNGEIVFGHRGTLAAMNDAEHDTSDGGKDVLLYAKPTGSEGRTPLNTTLTYITDAPVPEA